MLKRLTAVILTLLMCFTAFASEENIGVQVSYEKDSYFIVSLPKFISVKSDDTTAFTTKVTGELDDDIEVVVSADVNDCYLEDMSGVKNDVAYVVQLGKTVYSNSADTKEALANGVTANHTVTVGDIPSGRWHGNFVWSIVVRDK